MLLHRTPGIWLPQRKPLGGFKRWERDPAGVLARGLAMALLWDGPAGVGGILDYVQPQRKFTAHGTPTFSTGQFGPQQAGVFTLTANSVTCTPTTLPTTTWTLSALIQFDGNAHGGSGGVLVTQGLLNDWLFGINNTTPFPFIIGNFNSGNATCTNNPGNLNGWTRLTLTVNGTAARLFTNGKLLEAQTLSANVSSLGVSEIGGDFSSSFSWGWPIADCFLWTRTLSDPEVLAQHSNPYRSVLRPRLEDRPRGAMVSAPFIQRDLPPRGKVELVAY